MAKFSAHQHPVIVHVLFNTEFVSWKSFIFANLNAAFILHFLLYISILFVGYYEELCNPRFPGNPLQHKCFLPFASATTINTQIIELYIVNLFSRLYVFILDFFSPYFVLSVLHFGMSSLRLDHSNLDDKLALVKRLLQYRIIHINSSCSILAPSVN